MKNTTYTDWPRFCLRECWPWDISWKGKREVRYKQKKRKQNRIPSLACPRGTNGGRAPPVPSGPAPPMLSNSADRSDWCPGGLPRMKEPYLAYSILNPVCMCGLCCCCAMRDDAAWWCVLRDAWCVLCVVCYVVRVACCVLFVAWCMFACCAMRARVYIVRIACPMLLICNVWKKRKEMRKRKGSMRMQRGGGWAKEVIDSET